MPYIELLSPLSYANSSEIPKVKTNKQTVSKQNIYYNNQKTAMQEETDFLISNNTWFLMQLFLDFIFINNKWVYKNQKQILRRNITI